LLVCVVRQQLKLIMANRRNNRQRKNKVAAKSASMNNSLVLSSILTRGPSDPQPVQYTIEHVYRTRLTLAPAGSTDVAVTLGDLMGTVPGGATMWAQARLEHITVFSEATAQGYVRLRITNLQSATIPPQGGDGKTFEDFGTQGSLRPVVHVKPCLSLRQQWWDTAAAEENPTLFFVNHGSTGQLLVYATLHLRSVQRPT